MVILEAGLHCSVFTRLLEESKDGARQVTLGRVYHNCESITETAPSLMLTNVASADSKQPKETLASPRLLPSVVQSYVGAWGQILDWMPPR